MGSADGWLSGVNRGVSDSDFRQSIREDEVCRNRDSCDLKRSLWVGVGQELVQTCCGCVTVDITAKTDAPALSSGRHTSGSPPEVRCQQGPADVMRGFGPLLAPSALPWTHRVTREETWRSPMPPEQGGAGRTAASFGLEAAALDIWVSFNFIPGVSVMHVIVPTPQPLPCQLLRYACAPACSKNIRKWPPLQSS